MGHRPRVSHPVIGRSFNFVRTTPFIWSMITQKSPDWHALKTSRSLYKVNHICILLPCESIDSCIHLSFRHFFDYFLYIFNNVESKSRDLAQVRLLKGPAEGGNNHPYIGKLLNWIWVVITGVRHDGPCRIYTVNKQHNREDLTWSNFSSYFTDHESFVSPAAATCHVLPYLHLSHPSLQHTT